MNKIFKNTLAARIRRVQKILRKGPWEEKKKVFENLPRLFAVLNKEEEEALELLSAEGKKNKKYREEIKLKLLKIKNYLGLQQDL